MRPTIYLDFDGCLTPQRKLFFCRDGQFGVLDKAKLVSDHDSNAIQTFKRFIRFVVLSNDHCGVNKLWAARQTIDFMSPPKDVSKWDHLCFHWATVLGRSEVSPKGRYFYLGDALPDWECMENAKAAFYPSDASEMIHILAQQESHTHIHELATQGGGGCLDEMLLRLFVLDLLSKEILYEVNAQLAQTPLFNQ